MMNKTFEKIKDISNKLFYCCCFGSTTDSYGFSHAYSRAANTQLNLIEPYFDDVMQPIYDDCNVEMLVEFIIEVLFCFHSLGVPNSYFIYFNLLLTRFV